jgi:hypothetical protein
MWGSIGLWLATTRTGRFVAAAGALSLAIGVALLKAFSAGRQLERDKQDKSSLENLRNRQEIENEVNTLGGDDLDRRGRRWVRPDSEG